MNLTAGLNPPQRKAVMHLDGPLLVLAGAGSGKTRVIIHRIARLLSTGVPPEAIAALTFTNRAAAEVRERIAKLLQNKRQASKVTIGTFHSLGLQILKREYERLGLPKGFVVYDSADQIGLMRELLRRVHLKNRRFDVKAVANRISLAKNGFVRPEDYDPDEDDEYDLITAEMYPRYQTALRACGAVDFDDLVTEVVHLLETDAEVQDYWQRAFQHMLVDEYQDTNRSQLRFVKQLCIRHGNLCVVGDDDQSIYSWRGADPTNILQFSKTFPGAEVVKLEQNYRSTQAILSVANAVIANNQDRYGKELWTQKPGGDVVSHAVAASGQEEAKFVARRIFEMHEQDQRRYRDFAVLYRSNKQSQALEEELRSQRIPYVMYGGQQFYERKEVKDVIAYLRLALNARDEIALRRIVNYPARGIGPTTIQSLANWAKTRKVSLWQAVRDVERAPGSIRPGIRASIAKFVETIQSLQSSIRAAPAVSACRTLMNNIRLYDDLRASSPSIPAAQRRMDNIAALLRSLERFQKETPDPRALLEYLRQLSLASKDEEVETGDRVTLTTLHSAKGLEFPIVFLVGMEEEILPHARTLAPHSTDVNDPDHAATLAEERRLAYVGMTRAKEMLTMTRAHARFRHGKHRPRVPSRFLLEIPEDLIELRDLASEAQQPVNTEELRDFFRSF